VIQSLLIANRGEIACRIIRTARQMGIRTVAVYSDADAKALHVRQADEAVHIGPSPARESYLVGEKIIAAAIAANAEAIHPGYGFLSENAEFAQAVIDAGLIWVGPAPASITAMGLKDAAKTLMAAAGVPVTPGYMGADQDLAFLAERATEIGYPVLIKAVAGGGGKGMRKVEAAADFADALASCQREATASFGNAHVLIEKYIQRPRHIEVQVFGDTHGNIVHLFERDCSLQRRHQKVIEEAPAPGMDEATREQLCAVAVKAAKAVDYVGAGTIEFIADASEGLRADRIWFMEMNTRLQVEHPVTEEITGVDLVEWQLRVASGEPLPKRQDELSINGHAIEARLYAEDPAKGFLPSVGRLEHLRFGLTRDFDFDYSKVVADGGFTGNELDWQPPTPIRVETGVEVDSDVSPFYDPMIAKLVVHGEDRADVALKLASVCEQVEVWPVRTNAAFLAKLLKEPSFVQGDVTTGFIAEAGEALVQIEQLPDDRLSEAAVQLLWEQPADFQFRDGLLGFRANRDPQRNVTILIDGQPRMARLYSADEEIVSIHTGFDRLAIRDGDGLVLFSGGNPFRVSLRTDGSVHGPTSSGTILSPMPGKIIAVEVTHGQSVTKGQKLLTLEAMKMEHSLVAPFDGVVAELNAETGQQVQVEALLVRVEAVGAE
jgi:3-methylcrotonyl-CoA carboxylase alpha subunit